MTDTVVTVVLAVAAWPAAWRLHAIITRPPRSERRPPHQGRHRQVAR